MNVVLVLPVLIPLTAAALSLLAWRSRVTQRWLAVAGAAGLLGAAAVLLAAVTRGGIQATQAGGWPAPFGITLVADLFGAIMVLLAAIGGLAVTVYSLGAVDRRREAFGYYPLLMVLLMGVCGAFLTGDLFNLYVWFEVLLMASFVLLALGGERPQLEGAVKYVTLNLLSSAVFLAAAGLLYGVAGTLNMADLAGRLATVPEPGFVTALATLFLVAFGIKAALFPFYFWLPASYHTMPAPAAAVFAGLLTKVGVYALIRAFTLLFVGDVGYTHTLLLVLAALTMLAGMLGAIVQRDVRRMLAFVIVGHIGFPIMGLGLFTRGGLAGAVFYIVEDVLVLTNLFLIAGVVRRLSGRSVLAELGGLYRTRPGLALLYVVSAFSLAGMPPLAGFFAKLALIQAGLAAGRYASVAVALVASLLTLLVVARIWAEAFWKPEPAAPAPGPPLAPASAGPRPAGALLLLPVGALAALTVAIGLAAEPVFGLATAAAEQLLDRSAYVRVVLGGAS
jgi:multicomponent Na+:H+ antiporter subunit D